MLTRFVMRSRRSPVPRCTAAAREKADSAQRDDSVTPYAIVLVIANLLPLVGVAFWGWDAFVLLMLYWLETLVIAFWTILPVLVIPGLTANGMGARIGGSARAAGRVGTALFLAVHAGIFMAVHFLFLWTLFSGPWADLIHGPVDFVVLLVVGTGLWFPLLILFCVRGWGVFGSYLAPRLPFLPAAARPVALDEPSLLVALYVRIFVMQVAIIFGGWLAILSGGSIGALALLILAKTAVDLNFVRLAGRVDTATANAAAGHQQGG